MISVERGCELHHSSTAPSHDCGRLALRGLRTPLREALLAGAVAVFVSAMQADAAPDEPAGGTKSIPAVFTAVPPHLDGRLDDAVWQDAAVVEDLHMVAPTEYAPASEESRILVLYDSDALYFAARFYDREPDRVSALVMRQGDFSWGEDGFSVILDPRNQRRSGYVFDINPNGVRSQGLYTNTTQENWDWQAIWHGAALRDELGWTAEIAIPFKTLSFDPSNDTWGINFTRWLGRRNERFGWVSHNREQNPANSGLITGLTGLDQGAGIDLVPGFRIGWIDDNSRSAEDNYLEPSLDVFYKPTPSLTAALTLNTDFSGTTVDARQVNLTRFDLFFPEQRKFFLQDADIFEFGLIGDDSGKPFFSRRIGLTETGEAIDIEIGGKLTGRAGPFDIGVLGIRQDSPNENNPSELMVMRVAANVLAESSLGMIVTSGNPTEARDNELYGVDFRYLNTRTSRNRTILGSLWFQRTETEGVTGDSSAFGMSLESPARRGWLFESGWKEVQANYFPALGFVNRTGIREYEVEVGHNWRPEARWLRSITTGVDLERVQTIGGMLESQEVRINPLEIENHAADVVVLGYRVNRERLFEPFEISEGVVIPPGDYTFDSICIEGKTGQHRALSAEFSVCDGEFYDGSRTSLSPYLTWRPNAHLRFAAGFEWNDIDLPQGDFLTRLASLRADVAFSATWYLENFVQYDNVSESLGVNSILRWVPEAGRDIVVVLHRQLEDFDRDNRFESRYSELTFRLGYTFRF